MMLDDDVDILLDYNYFRCDRKILTVTLTQMTLRGKIWNNIHIWNRSHIVAGILNLNIWIWNGPHISTKVWIVDRRLSNKKNWFTFILAAAVKATPEVRWGARRKLKFDFQNEKKNVCLNCFVKIYLQNFKTRDNMELFVVKPLVCFNTFFWHSLEECGKYFFMFLPATLCMLAATLNSHFLPPKMKCCKKELKLIWVSISGIYIIKMIGMDLIS